tara:strand:- start:724 stop:1260 length:537 start_codon:yes stop_codon:yes gene_type:complete
MFDFLKDILLSFKLKKNLKTLQNQKKKKITSFKSVLIIVYENDLDEDFLLLFAANLKISINNLYIIVLNQNEIDLTETRFKRKIYISKDEISMTGNIKKELNYFFNRKYDLLVNFFDKKEILSELISSKCFSKLRIGFSKANPQINDIVFNFGMNDKKTFLSESMNYLNSFIKQKNEF